MCLIVNFFSRSKCSFFLFYTSKGKYRFIKWVPSSSFFGLVESDKQVLNCKEQLCLEDVWVLVTSDDCKRHLWGFFFTSSKYNTCWVFYIIDALTIFIYVLLSSYSAMLPHCFFSQNSLNTHTLSCYSSCKTKVSYWDLLYYIIQPRVKCNCFFSGRPSKDSLGKENLQIKSTKKIYEPKEMWCRKDFPAAHLYAAVTIQGDVALTLLAVLTGEVGQVAGS